MVYASILLDHLDVNAMKALSHHLKEQFVLVSNNIANMQMCKKVWGCIMWCMEKGECLWNHI